MTALAGRPVHPFADAFPMLPADELDALTEDIAANGLRQPIVIDKDGQLIDGRNRLAACARAGIDPQTVVYDGDPVDYIVSANVERRHMSTGQRAMARAMALGQGKRPNGRWERDVVDNGNSSNIDTWRKAMFKAGVVLDETPHVAPDVLTGPVSLDAAYKDAKAVRDGRNTAAARLAELREHAPDLAALVDGGADLGEQHAAWKERERNRRQHAARVSESVRNVIRWATGIAGSPAIRAQTVDVYDSTLGDAPATDVDAQALATAAQHLTDLAALWETRS